MATNQTNNDYLPIRTLNWLEVNVCRSLEAFERFSSKTIWDNPIKECKELEKDPDSISTFIIEKNCDNGVIKPGIKRSHQLAARDYVLMYYRHRDNPICQKDIFPVLKKLMGPYGDDKVVAEIERKTDERIEIDKKANRYVAYPIPVMANEEAADDDSDMVEETKSADKLKNKVRYEFFLELLEKAGTNVSQCNITRLSELWEMITGNSRESFRRFCSERSKYNNDHTRNDIIRLNAKLSECGIDIHLSFEKKV